MKRYWTLVTVVTLWVFISISEVSGQKETGKAVVPPPQLAGTWTFVSPKGLKPVDRSMVISQTADELVIEESVLVDGKPLVNFSRYLLNGKGEKNRRVFPGDDRSFEIDSQTKIKKGKIVRTYSLSNTLGSIFIQSNVIEQYWLEDSDTLIVEMNSLQNGRPTVAKWKFIRKP